MGAEFDAITLKGGENVCHAGACDVQGLEANIANFHKKPTVIHNEDYLPLIFNNGESRLLYSLRTKIRLNHPTLVMRDGWETAVCTSISTRTHFSHADAGRSRQMMCAAPWVKKVQNG